MNTTLKISNHNIKPGWVINNHPLLQNSQAVVQNFDNSQINWLIQPQFGLQCDPEDTCVTSSQSAGTLNHSINSSIQKYFILRREKSYNLIQSTLAKKGEYQTTISYPSARGVRCDLLILVLPLSSLWIRKKELCDLSSAGYTAQVSVNVGVCVRSAAPVRWGVCIQAPQCDE